MDETTTAAAPVELTDRQGDIVLGVAEELADRLGGRLPFLLRRYAYDEPGCELTASVAVMRALSEAVAAEAERVIVKGNHRLVASLLQLAAARPRVN